MRTSYANVASTLALVFSLGAGGAYAAATITGADIVDGSIHAVDLGANSVISPKVRDDALTGNDIDESTLGQVPDAATVGGVPETAIAIGRHSNTRTLCDPAGVGTFKLCAAVDLTLPRPSRVLVIASGSWYSGTAEAHGVCALKVDNVQQPEGVPLGQRGGNAVGATDSSHQQAFTVATAAAHISGDPVLPAGQHVFLLICNQLAGDMKIDNATLSTVTLGSD